MNQEEVAKKLKQLYESPIPFTVTFTGKQSGRVNGFYIPEKQSILIHNRNRHFKDNDNMLMYTAIHELAHHICITEKKEKTVRSHTQFFWSTFHTLLDTAERQGIYQQVINEQLNKLIAEAKRIDREIAKLQQELGRILLEIYKESEKAGARFEDICDREVGISKKTRDSMIKAAQLDQRITVGQDVQNLLIKEKNDDLQGEILLQKEKSSIAQIQMNLRNRKQPEPGTVEKLETDRRRIEKTIDTLTKRLREIIDEIAHIKSEDKEEMSAADHPYTQ